MSRSWFSTSSLCACAGLTGMHRVAAPSVPGRQTLRKGDQKRRQVDIQAATHSADHDSVMRGLHLEVRDGIRIQAANQRQSAMSNPDARVPRGGNHFERVDPRREIVQRAKRHCFDARAPRQVRRRELAPSPTELDLVPEDFRRAPEAPPPRLRRFQDHRNVRRRRPETVNRTVATGAAT